MKKVLIEIPDELWNKIDELAQEMIGNADMYASVESVIADELITLFRERAEQKTFKINKTQ